MRATGSTLFDCDIGTLFLALSPLIRYALPMPNRVSYRARPKRLVAEAMGRDEVLRVDGRLASLGRGLGAMRLRIGEGLVALGEGYRELGFPTVSYTHLTLPTSDLV